MPLNQSIDSALDKNIGTHGVSDAALSAALARTEGALDRLRRHYAEGTLPLLRLPEEQDDLAAIGEVAARLKEGATDIVILGTGGSSLGGQTLAQLADFNVPGVGVLRDPPRIHFIDNLDPVSFEASDPHRSRDEVIDAGVVRTRLRDIVEDEDLSRYIL